MIKKGGKMLKTSILPWVQVVVLSIMNHKKKTFSTSIVVVGVWRVKVVCKVTFVSNPPSVVI